jgi:hypothetical protein
VVDIWGSNVLQLVLWKGSVILTTCHGTVDSTESSVVAQLYARSNLQFLHCLPARYGRTGKRTHSCIMTADFCTSPGISPGPAHYTCKTHSSPPLRARDFSVRPMTEYSAVKLQRTTD